MEMEYRKLLHCMEFKFNRKLVPFNVKTPWLTVLIQKILLMSKQQKREKSPLLLEEYYDDYEETEEEQDMV